MVAPELLEILCCPETHQSISVAPSAVIESLNKQIAAQTLKNRAGKPVSEPLDSGLIRDDGNILYPVRQYIPVMLIDEGIWLKAP